MKIRFVILASTLIISACASTSNELKDNELSDSSDNTVASDNELVCKREKIIGSNFSRKVCFTRESREEAADNSRQRLERMRNQRSSTTGNIQ